MQILIKLELEDITVRPFGDGFEITPETVSEDGPTVSIAFSPEAARELVADLQQLLELKEESLKHFRQSGKGYLGQVTRLEERSRERSSDESYG